MELNELTEEDILLKLKAIIAPQQKQDTYSIDKHSHWCCFFMRTDARRVIEDLANTRDSDLLQIDNEYKKVKK